MYNNGSFHEALAHFDQITQLGHLPFSLHSNLASFYSGMTHCNLGILAIYTGNYEAAIDHLEAAVHFIPQEFAPFYYMGIAYNNLGQFDEAMDAFNKVAYLNPDFLPVKARVALVFYNEARYQDAQKELENILVKNPQWADMYYHLGLIKASQGNYAEGLKDVEASLNINPHYLKARIMKGVLLAQTGNSEEGSVILAQVHRERPQFPDVCYYLGLVYASMNQLEEADKMLQRAVNLNPNYVDAHFLRGLVLIASGRYDEARGSLKFILSLKPDHREAKMIMFQIENLRNQENFQDNSLTGNQFSDRILELLPRHVHILPEFTDIVHIFSPEENPGLYWSLIRFFESTAERNPHYADVFENMGALYAKLEEYDKSVYCFRQALSTNPRYARARINLYRVLRTLGKYNEVLTELDHLLEQGLKFPDLYMDRGKTLSILGKKEEAKKRSFAGHFPE